jgi:prophage regulatory protein
MTTTYMLTERAVGERLGLRHSTIWLHTKDGLLTRPVKMGARASRWPSGEIEEIVQARCAGKDDDEIRRLVNRLHRQRLGHAENAESNTPADAAPHQAERGRGSRREAERAPQSLDAA